MATQNTGTSGKIIISKLNMRENQYFKVSKFTLDEAHPPIVSENDKNSILALKKWINPWPEISFEKINFPKYDGSNNVVGDAGVYQYLGEPSNKPDYIKDYHIISLARLVDYWAEPAWEGKIVAKVTSVNFFRGRSS